ncbi:DUF7146 domain-containing protein [Bradyrhizobium sp. CCBAU 11434]|uniref:DUF7146 domain-containing protein n=1 Tax=Bradyrhizobium sp. CCBAU 11434 TaxID=1630885 RepID=UPI002306C713|nr:toprim domain-containing protein [Bradyrhizobium sp. CCBAU 11434]
MPADHKSSGTPDASLDDLRAELIRRAAEVANTLLGAPDHEHQGRHELRWGRKGSLCVKIENGLWIDHESGEGGSLLDLIMREQACDIGDAIKWAREFCGIWDVPNGDNITHRNPRRGTDVVREASKTALQIFRDATGLDHPVAQRYLERRRLILPCDLSPALRFNLQCPFGPSDAREYRPALIALMRDIRTDEPRAIIRIKLTMEAEKEGPFALGPIDGCACKLTPDEEVTLGLHVAEGVETAIAAMMLGFVPMWALGFCGGIAKLPVLSGIECLTIMVDHDKRNPRTGRIPGPDAARECSARWTTAGVHVRRVVPNKPGDDMADIVEREAAYG